MEGEEDTKSEEISSNDNQSSIKSNSKSVQNRYHPIIIIPSGN